MAQDINSYALNLELNFQDRATENLRKTLNVFGDMETKAMSVNASLAKTGSFGEKAADRIRSGFDKAVASLTSLFDGQATQTAAAVKSFAEIEQAAKELEQFSEKGNKWDLLRKRYQDQYQKAYLKFSKRVKEDYKGEKLTKKQLKQFSDDELKYYNHAQAAMKGIGQATRAEAASSDKSIQQKQDLALLGQTIATTFKQAFGQLASAASAAGLFDVAVLKSADTAEKFHTINYRNIGTMDQLNDEMIKLGISGEATKEKWVEATIALRELGAGRSEIETLRRASADYSRYTGADIKATSKFGVVLNRTTKDQNFAAKQLSVMSHYQKEFAFTGEDMNAILEQTSQDALFMGSTGAQGISDYNNALLRGAAAAKGLGRPIHEATDLIKAMKDPLSTVAILGGESLDWDFKKRTQEMAKWAKDAEKQLAAVADSPRDTMIAIKTMQGRLQAGGINVGYDDLPAKLKMLQGQLDENPLKPKLEIPAINPEAEMTKNLKDAEGLKQKNALTESRILSNLEDKLKIVRTAFESFLDWLNRSPFVLEMATWGIAVAGLGKVAMASFRLLGGGARDAFEILKAAKNYTVQGFEFLVSGFKQLGNSAVSTWQAVQAAPTVMSKFGAVLRAPLGPLATLGVAVYGAQKIWETWQAAVANDEAWKTAKKEILSTYNAIAEAKQRLDAAAAMVTTDAKIDAEIKKLENQKSGILAVNKEVVDTAKQVEIWSLGLSKPSAAALQNVQKRTAEVRSIDDQIAALKQKGSSYQEETYKKELDAAKSGKALTGMSKERISYLQDQISAQKESAAQDITSSVETMAAKEAAQQKQHDSAVALLAAESRAVEDAKQDWEKLHSAPAGVADQVQIVADAHAKLAKAMNKPIDQFDDLIKLSRELSAAKPFDKMTNGAENLIGANNELAKQKPLEGVISEIDKAAAEHQKLEDALKPPEQKAVKDTANESSSAKMDRQAKEAIQTSMSEMAQYFGAASQFAKEQSKLVIPQANEQLRSAIPPPKQENDETVIGLAAIAKKVEDVHVAQQDAAVQQLQQQAPLKPDSIVTVKMDDTTAREKTDAEGDRHKITSGMLSQQVEILHKILLLLGTKDLSEIKEILKQYLPELAREADSGLASTANQWMY